ncbi:MAG: DUF554 domain-containing protein [Archaeoglobaceae archaeon]
MLGTLINSIAIVVGSIVGALLGSRIKEGLRENLIRVLGLCVFVLGVGMAMKMQNFLIVTFSIVVGYFVGESIGNAIGFERLEKWIEGKFTGHRFAEGFITASLLFCVGSMAILGPLEEGLTGNRSILLAKSLLDGIASMILASTLGIGVAFSALIVLAYQGFFTVFAGFISGYLTAYTINEINATGGVMICAIGLNLAKIANFKVGSTLPALPMTAILSSFSETFIFKLP